MNRRNFIGALLVLPFAKVLKAGTVYGPSRLECAMGGIIAHNEAQGLAFLHSCEAADLWPPDMLKKIQVTQSIYGKVIPVIMGRKHDG